MSSHHIVREKQEPALLLLGLGGLSQEHLGQLLEWNPTVLGTPDTAESLFRQGLKVDAVICGCDYTSRQGDVQLLPAGNDTPVEAALKYLVLHDFPAVNVVTDDLQLKDYLFFADKIDLVIFFGGKKIYPVHSGFSKWKTAGEIVEVLTHPQELLASGLDPIGNHRYMTRNDGFFTLRFDQPTLFIAEYL